MTPIGLYRLVMDSKVWNFTSSDVPQVYDAGAGVEMYIPLSVGRGEIQQSTSITKNDLEIRIPIDHELSMALISAYSEQKMSITVFTNRDGSIEVSWKGRLAGVLPDNAFLKLNGESIFTSLRRSGLRAKMQRSCRHTLYSAGCTLDPEAFAVDTTLSSIAGNVLTVPGAADEPDGFYLAGMVRDPTGALTYVIDHTGTSLVLQRVPFTLAKAFAEAGAGMAIKIYPGCDLARQTCGDKFANGDNYGGFDWIPNKNPMGGASIT